MEPNLHATNGDNVEDVNGGTYEYLYANQSVGNINTSFQYLAVAGEGSERDQNALSFQQAEDSSNQASRKSQNLKKKTISRKKKLEKLTKATFSSNQKSISPYFKKGEPVQQNQDLVVTDSNRKREMHSTSPVQNSSLYQNALQSRSLNKNKQKDEAMLDQLKTLDKVDLSNSVINIQMVPFNVQNQHQNSIMKIESRRKMSQSVINSHSSSKTKIKKTQLEQHTENIVSRLSDKINNQAIKLTEKMKKINICDLYQFASHKQNPDIVKSLIEHKQEQDLEAYSDAAAVNKYANEFLIKDFQKSVQMPRSMHNSPVGQAIGRYMKGKGSVIPEANEEELMYASNNTPEKQQENAIITNQCSPKHSLPKSFPTNTRSNQSQQNIMIKNFISNPFVKKAYNGDESSERRRLTQGKRVAIAKKRSNPHIESIGSKLKNKYLANLNKKYVNVLSVSRSSSRLNNKSLARPTVTNGQSSSRNNQGTKQNLMNRSQINGGNEFDLIEKSVQKDPNRSYCNNQMSRSNTVLPNKSATKIKSKLKTGMISQFANSFFQRKNSSPQPLRMRGLQIKYAQTEVQEDISETTPQNNMNAHQKILNRLAQRDKSTMKNNYIYPELKEYQQDTIQTQPQAGTERRNPNMTIIDLQLMSQKESSEFSDIKGRRSRKERSRDTKLANNRPKSENIEQSSKSAKKQILAYQNYQDQVFDQTQNQRNTAARCESISEDNELVQDHKSNNGPLNTFQKLINDRISLNKSNIISETTSDMAIIRLQQNQERQSEKKKTKPRVASAGIKAKKDIQSNKEQTPRKTKTFKSSFVDPKLTNSPKNAVKKSIATSVQKTFNSKLQANAELAMKLQTKSEPYRAANVVVKGNKLLGSSGRAAGSSSLKKNPAPPQIKKLPNNTQVGQKPQMSKSFMQQANGPIGALEKKRRKGSQSSNTKPSDKKARNPVLSESENLETTQLNEDLTDPQPLFNYELQKIINNKKSKSKLPANVEKKQSSITLKKDQISASKSNISSGLKDRVQNGHKTSFAQQFKCEPLSFDKRNNSVIFNSNIEVFNLMTDVSQSSNPQRSKKQSLNSDLKKLLNSEDAFQTVSAVNIQVITGDYQQSQDEKGFQKQFDSFANSNKNALETVEDCGNEENPEEESHTYNDAEIITQSKIKKMSKAVTTSFLTVIPDVSPRSRYLNLDNGTDNLYLRQQQPIQSSNQTIIRPESNVVSPLDNLLNMRNNRRLSTKDDTIFNYQPSLQTQSTIKAYERGMADYQPSLQTQPTIKAYERGIADHFRINLIKIDESSEKSKSNQDTKSRISSHNQISTKQNSLQNLQNDAENHQENVFDDENEIGNEEINYPLKMSTRQSAQSVQSKNSSIKIDNDIVVKEFGRNQDLDSIELLEEMAPEPTSIQPLPSPKAEKTNFTNTSQEPQHNKTISLYFEPNTELKKNIQIIQEEIQQANEDVKSVINKLEKNINASNSSSLKRIRRKSQNPYLNGNDTNKLSSNISLRMPEEMHTPVKEPQLPATITLDKNLQVTPPTRIKKLLIEKAKSQKSSNQRKAEQVPPEMRLPMQYGLYNPYNGIPVYKIDLDFENEDDGFKIKPTKIFQRNSVGANKASGGRGSPITTLTAATTISKNSNSRRQKASRQASESAKHNNSAINENRLKLNSNAVVRTRKTDNRQPIQV